MWRLLKPLAIILVVSSGGFLLALGAHVATRATPSQIAVLGTPIVETAFGVLVNESWEWPTQHEFMVNASDGTLVTLRYETYTEITSARALEITRDFLGAELVSFLDAADAVIDISVDESVALWRVGFRVVNETDALIIQVALDLVSGEVCGFHWHTKGTYDAPICLRGKPIVADGQPVNQSLAERAAAQFMASHGLLLPSSTRLLGVYGSPNRETPVFYYMEMTVANTTVVMDESFRGVFVRLDAVTGAVIDLRFRCIRPPVLSTVGVMNPDMILDSLVNERQDLTELTYETRFLGLVSRGHPTSGREVFQLAWVHRFVSSAGDILEVGVEAHSGDELLPHYDYIPGGIEQFLKPNLFMLLPVMTCGLGTPILYWVLRRYAATRED